MKKLLLALAVVGATLFTACNKDQDCGHEFIEHDFSKDLVGTWTCLTADYAEALVIKADGSVVSTGVENGEYWDGVKGSIKTTNNKMTLLYEDNDNYEGRFEMICGEAFTIFDENGKHLTYRYCANDLADEVLGMWVCNDAPNNAEKDIAIVSFEEDGTSTLTGIVPNGNGYLVTANSTYKVVGDLQFQKRADDETAKYIVSRLIYTPNATTSGDIMNYKMYITTDIGKVETTTSWLRVRQSLDLAGKTYDYSSSYVSNAKGKNEDFSIMGYNFNMSKITSDNFDMMFRTVLFYLTTNTNSIKQHFFVNGKAEEIETPITVDGNKVIFDMSVIDPAFRTVEMYMYQDADNCQLHMYLPTTSFINNFANLEIATLKAEGKLDTTNAAAVAKVFADMEARVESINISFVLKIR